jgi:hypothetical protein
MNSPPRLQGHFYLVVVVVVVVMMAVLNDHYLLVMVPPAVQASVMIAVVIAVRLDDDDRSLCVGAGNAERHRNADGRERGKRDSKFTHEDSSRISAKMLFIDNVDG